MESVRKRDGRSLDHKALEDIRIQAVQRVEAGEAPSAVMRVMGFARTVIYDWLNKYRAGGIEALRALPIPGRPPKLTEQQRAWVYRTVTQNNPLQLQFEFALWTRAMVRDLIRQHCGVTLSLASVGRLLRSLGLTPQRPVRRAIEQVPAKVREWLTVDYPAIQAKARKAGAQIFFADEAGVRSNSHHSGTTWAPMGQTPVVPATGKRFGLNLVSAVSPQGVLRFMVVDGRMTAVRFIAFLNVPHPVSWTQVWATRLGVARTARGPRVACDRPASRGASTGCSARRTRRRRRARRRDFERPGRRRPAP